MTQKESPEQSVQGADPKTAKKVVATAPELPHAVAKQYGLHSHGIHAAAPEKTAPVDSSLLANDETDAAVDAIVAQESDTLLAMQDAPLHPVPATRRGFWHRIGGFFAAWWRNRWTRYITIVVVGIALAAVAIIPQVRYATLNTLGVRSSASIVVVDSVTRLPLKNVTVQLAGAQTKTDIKGKAVFRDVRLGPAKLHVKRIAFAPQSKDLTIGWGSNPLGTYTLQATGVQYVLYATDYLSGKAVGTAEAVSDEANAVADKAGKIVLTVDDTTATTLTVTLQAEGYRDETLTLDAEREGMAPKVSLVPQGKEVFISRHNGTYDLYSSDIDGKNKQLVLAGTGSETSNIGLVTDPGGEHAALVSAREGIRDKDGYPMATLTLIDLQDNTTSVVDRATQIQLIEWTADRLVYRASSAGASAANSQRYRLISYHAATNNKTQLATANQFTVSLSDNGYIYYAASSTDPKATDGLFRVRPDGSSKKKVLDQEIWTGFRTTYDTMSLQTPKDWYLYALDTDKVAPTTAPANFTGYLFSRSGSTNRYAWVDQRDGKGTLLLYDADEQKTTTVLTQDGLAQPVRWLHNALLYRVATAGETADYAVSLQGGEGRKITDVTTSYGFSGGY